MIKLKNLKQLKNKLTGKTKNAYATLINKINPSLDINSLKDILDKFIKAEITDGQVILYEFITTKDVDNSTLTGKCE